MRLRYSEPGLHELDKEHAVCLVLTAFSDDRPLRGLAGRVDWRLNGQLSGLMKKSFIDGHFTEAMLTPIANRLPFGQLLFVGMGERAAFSEKRFAEICQFTFETLSRMHVTDFAMALPGRIGLDVGLRQALQGWEDGIAVAFPAEMIQQLNICIIESEDVQRELVEPLRRICEDLDNRAAEALRADGQVETPQELPRPNAEARHTEETETGFDANRRRDWSTGMFRIIEDPVQTVDEDDEISVAAVPATRRRSGLFTIPEARSGHDALRAGSDAISGRVPGVGGNTGGVRRVTGQFSVSTAQGGASARTTGAVGTKAMKDTGRERKNHGEGLRRAPEFTGARRPSGQFAAVRRASGQYEIPTRRTTADFNAPPVIAPSEPIDRTRRISGITSRIHTATGPTRRAATVTPRRTTQPQAAVQVESANSRSQARPTTDQLSSAPWSAAPSSLPSQSLQQATLRNPLATPGVHVEPPLLATDRFDEPVLTDEFHLGQGTSAAAVAPREPQFSMPLADDDESGFDRDF